MSGSMSGSMNGSMNKWDFLIFSCSGNNYSCFDIIKSINNNIALTDYFINIFFSYSFFKAVNFNIRINQSDFFFGYFAFGKA